MAINTTTFHPDQWIVAIIPETTSGTKVTTAMHKLNVDKPITVIENPYVSAVPRLGTGRSLKVTDRVTVPKGSLKTITLAGIADTTTFPMMMENAFSIAEASGTIDVNYNFTGHAVGIGDAATDNIHLFTVALVQPITDKSIVFPGCAVQTIGWVDDSKAEGGCRTFTCTFASRGTTEHDATDPTYANNGMLYGTYYSIWDYDDTNGQKKLFVNDVVLDKLAIDIDAGVRWQGVGASGVGETVTRGLPYMKVTGSADVKWDANTQVLVQRYAAANTTATSGTLVIGNVYLIQTFVAGDDFTNVGAGSNATGVIFQATGTTPTTWTNASTLEYKINCFAVDIRDHTTLASATTGFKGDYCAITADVDVIDADDAGFVTMAFEAQAVNVASSYICQIPV